ncbi:MAG TPA: MFS transporter [bacterium]
MSNKTFILGFAFLTIFIDTAGYQIVIPTIPIFAENIGLTESRLGLLYSSYGIASLLLYIPFGYLVDRYGKRVFLTGGLFALGISSISFATSETFAGLLASRIIQGVSASSTWAAVIPLVAGVADARKKGISMSGIAISYSAGAIIGPALGGLGSIKFPFYVFSAFPFILALISLAIPDNNNEIKNSAGEDPLIIIKKLFLNTGLIISSIALFAAFLAIGAMEIMIPLHLNNLNVPRIKIGGTFAIIGVLSSGFQLICGWWSDKRGRVEPIITGIFLLAILFPFINRIQNVYALIILLIPLSFSFSAALAPTLPFISDSIHVSNLGLAYGIYNTIFSVGLITGSLLGTVIAEGYGWNTAIIAIALVTLSSGLAILWIKR